jgi:hypothetical protein
MFRIFATLTLSASLIVREGTHYFNDLIWRLRISFFGSVPSSLRAKYGGGCLQQHSIFDGRILLGGFNERFKRTQ